MEYLKHVGERKDSGVRLAVVFMSMPDDPESALVADLDAMQGSGSLGEDIMEVIRSSEGQNSRNLSDILHRRKYRYGGSLLEALHNERKLMKIPTTEVLMKPHPSVSMSLAEINHNIRKLEEGTEHISDEQIAIDRNVKKQQIESMQETERENIGRRLQFEAQELEEQAKLMVKDAQRKRNEAEQYFRKEAKKEKIHSSLNVSGITDPSVLEDIAYFSSKGKIGQAQAIIDTFLNQSVNNESATKKRGRKPNVKTSS